MRSLAIVAALVLSGSAAAADSNSFQLRDAADLARVCGTPASDPSHANALGFCHGFLTGAFQYYHSAVAASNRFVCSPNPTPTRSKVMSDFVAWSNQHPGYMKDPAADTLFRYLAETYPCKTGENR